MRTDQRDRVAQSLIGLPHDTYAMRAREGSDADLVSIELGLISIQARAAGLAGIEDNTDPAYRLLVHQIEEAITTSLSLRSLRTT